MTKRAPTTADGGFTLAAVGDCIVSRPLGPSVARVRGFGDVLGALREADVAFGNLETTIADVGAAALHPYGIAEDWALLAPPSVGPDLRSLGLGLVGRANNHSMDWGPGGLRSTARLLDAAGIVHAGAGEHLAAARAPRYIESPRGRVALVSITTTPGGDGSAALEPHGQVPGRPGVNAMRSRPRITAPPDAMRSLRALRDAFPESDTSWIPIPKQDQTPETELEMFRAQFVPGDTFAVSYEFDESDVRENLRSIRLGALHADVAIVAVHAHQGDHAPQNPPEALRAFARAAIDAGADAVIVSGPHRLAPIEVHEGRPIFYGLGDFVWSDIQEPLQHYFYERSRALIGEEFSDSDLVTDADLLRILNARVFSSEQIFQAVVSVVGFSNDAVEIRLHPVELGQGEPLTTSGIPRPASAEAGAKILARIGEMSSPFGTQVAVENGVGVVRTER